MSGLQIRQGTVYSKRATGARLLLIHHDIMNLQSMAVPGDADGNFDCAGLSPISIDELIALRKSGDYDELGDVPPEVFQAIVKQAVELNREKLPQETVAALENLVQS